MDELEQELYDALLEFDEDEVLKKIDELINANMDKLEIAKVCKDAMDEVGRLFQEKEIFLTELIMAGELLNIAMEKLGFSTKTSDKPDSEFIGKVVLGTVKGDVHDIGKNIVGSLLASNDFKVIDLGTDITSDMFIQAIKDYNPQIVAMSGLLTIAYDSMKEIVDLIVEEGLRENIKIMIGGGSTDQKVCDFVGADAYGADATDGVLLAKKWVGK